ncbi:MAG: putative RND superfamily exporter protein, partial [Kiritimatiellia bacterium]
MKKTINITEWSIRWPGLVMLLVIALVVGLGSQFPRVTFDNNPENMLAEDEPVRLFHKNIRAQYDLYDFVVVGVVNESDPDGIFNPGTLARLHTLTHELISLRPGPDGRPQVLRDGTAYTPDLTLQSKREQILAKAFNHDPEHLFDANSNSVIIAREIISPSVVDNIKQAERGQLKIEYLMEQAPTTREEARVIRDDAMNNPLYKGTLVSEDGKAVGLYLPITDKHFSHNVAGLVEALTADWPVEDQVHITGLPVAEDTFGIQMLIQMASSAPMAGLAIFILLWMFFRRLSLIIAPMIVAMVSVIVTMGLLIGLGFDVHIMSSMIAIFLMPIAVADSVHILSEFFDTYPRFRSKSATIRHVISHLFKPMLFTSLTTMAGFASLALTPIPPVRIFGLHIAFGVGLAWLLSITLIPAYIMWFVPKGSLENLSTGAKPKPSLLDPMLAGIGRFAHARWKLVLVVAMALLVVAGFGIAQIKVNDNPVRWFSPSHKIRIADRVLNDHFGGTYTAYLTFKSDATAASTWPTIRQQLVNKLGDLDPAIATALENQSMAELRAYAASHDANLHTSWNALGDGINFLEPEGLTASILTEAVKEITNAASADKNQLLAHVLTLGNMDGAELQNQVLDYCDRQVSGGLVDFIDTLESNLNAPLFKRPEVLAWVEGLQEHLLKSGRIGKSSSVVDSLKKANYELLYEAGATAEANQQHYAIPPTAAATAQVYTQLEGMKKKDSLFHLVTRDYQEANIWVQLKSGDNQNMEVVVKDVAAYVQQHPDFPDLQVGWAGLTYINVVWQDKMVRGMLGSLSSSFFVVLVMMMLLFRSPLLGLLSMVPLSLTIALIYGII